MLSECHGPLRGRLEDIVALVTLPDGRELQVFAALPAAVRYQSADGVVTLRGDQAQRRADPASNDRATSLADAAVDEDERQFAQALRRLLDAVTLGPLQRAVGSRRTAVDRCELLQPDGTTWTLQLRPDSLLVDRLGFPGGEVIVREHLRTSATWIVRRVEMPPLGDCRITIDAWGLDWSDDFFATTPSPQDAAPAAPKETGDPARVVKISSGSEARSPTPVAGFNRAQRWVVLDDPGDWQQRHELYRAHYQELDRQQQQSAGFPLFFDEGGRARLAVPFRRRQGGPEFAPPAGWVLRDHDERKVLVVYPPEGTYAERVAAGSALLQQALRQPGVVADGPLTVQPFLHLHQAAPDESKLAAPVIRMFVPLR